MIKAPMSYRLITKILKLQIDRKSGFMRLNGLIIKILIQRLQRMFIVKLTNKNKLNRAQSLKFGAS
jgi:hypothetical protein